MFNLVWGLMAGEAAVAPESQPHVPSGTSTILCLCSELLQETQLAEKLEVWGTFVWLLFIWGSSGFLCYFMNSGAGTEEEMQPGSPQCLKLLWQST